MGRAGDGEVLRSRPTMLSAMAQLLPGMEHGAWCCTTPPGFQLHEKKVFKAIKGFTAYGHQQLASSHLGREAGKGRTGVLRGKVGDVLPGNGSVVCTHPDGSPQMQVLQRWQDAAAASCSVEAARHFLVMPRGSGQPWLGHESPHGSAGHLHCHFC